MSNKKKIIITLLIVLITLIIIVVGIMLFINSTLSKIQFEQINKSNLDVNEGLYNDVKEIMEQSKEDETTNITETEFKDIINIALFGTDSRDVNGIGKGRSDSIMVVSINPIKKNIKLMSIPRDTYVNIPKYGLTKINHAYAYGKEELSIKTINNNFGLNLTEYVTIDFAGLINVINYVGGIEATISKEERDAINNYLKESYKLSGNPYVKLENYGKVNLNGEQALAHARDRSVDSDFQRTNRQRDILIALLNKMSKMEKSKIFDLINLILLEIKTNVSVINYTPLITSMISNKEAYFSNIISVQIPSTEYSSGKTINGVYYFVTDYEKSKLDFIKYIYQN